MWKVWWRGGEGGPRENRFSLPATGSITSQGKCEEGKRAMDWRGER